MIISVPDIWASAEQKHTSYLSNILKDGIEGIKKKPELKSLTQFLENNRNAILSTNPDGLSESIKDYHSKFPTEEEKKAAKKTLEKIFNYNNFIKKPDRANVWCAYELCAQAKYSFCSYCHISPTDTVPPDDENKGYRPNIDHYYAKAEYPFLALTLGNFIPCCEKCNSRQMKGTIDFSKEPHLNPLLHEESIEFELIPMSAKDNNLAQGFSLSLDKEKYQLSLNIKSNDIESQASLKTFQLSNRYKPYLGDAFHLARRLRGGRSRIEMQNEALDFKIDYEDYLGFNEDDYRSTGLGKMKLCIAKRYS
jgi:hypothetical protein